MDWGGGGHVYVLGQFVAHMRIADSTRNSRLCLYPWVLWFSWRLERRRQPPGRLLGGEKRGPETDLVQDEGVARHRNPVAAGEEPVGDQGRAAHGDHAGQLGSGLVQPRGREAADAGLVTAGIDTEDPGGSGQPPRFARCRATNGRELRRPWTSIASSEGSGSGDLERKGLS